MLIPSRLFLISCSRFAWLLAGAMLAALLMGCAPQHDWREVAGPEGDYRAWMPAKPTSQSRTVPLAGAEVPMSMAAAQVGTLTYAIGSARLPQAALAPAALEQLKAALVGNIGGRLQRERRLDAPEGGTRLEIEAVGAMPGKGQDDAPLLLVAQLVAHRDRVYQVVAMGPEKDLKREEVATFLTGFRLR